MDENNQNKQTPKEPTKKEKAVQAGKDLTEVAAKGASSYFGGPVAGAVTDKVIQSDAGQKVLNTAGHLLSKNPLTRQVLSKAQPTISKAKPLANTTIDMANGKNGEAPSSNENAENINKNNNQNNDFPQENNNQEDTSSHNDNPDEEKNNKNKVLIKGLPTKYKLILIGIGLSLIGLIFFIVIIIAIFMVLGIIDADDLTSNLGGTFGGENYTSVNSSYWWPIGGTENGLTFDDSAPACTNIYSNYGTREGEDGSIENHAGIDISCGGGSNVYNVIAALDGTVETVVNGYPDGLDQSAGYGNYVKIAHSDGSVTIYGHMYKDSIIVSEGDTVKQGQVLGKMGSSGYSTGTHLHFEIRVNGTAVDPNSYVSGSDPRPITAQDSTYINGNSNQQSVCLTLKNKNISNNGIIAIMTNMNFESGFNPNASGDSGDSYGLCQWHLERYDNLKNTYPNGYTTIESQLDFLMYELQTYYGGLYNDLVSGKDTDANLTYQFCYNFERPDHTETTCTNRKNNVSNYTNYVNNGCQ